MQNVKADDGYRPQVHVTTTFSTQVAAAHLKLLNIVMRAVNVS